MTAPSPFKPIPYGSGENGIFQILVSVNQCFYSIDLTVSSLTLVHQHGPCASGLTCCASSLFLMGFVTLSGFACKCVASHRGRCSKRLLRGVLCTPAGPTNLGTQFG